MYFMGFPLQEKMHTCSLIPKKPSDPQAEKHDTIKSEKIFETRSFGDERKPG
jgi:hypothetical protein